MTKCIQETNTTNKRLNTPAKTALYCVPENDPTLRFILACKGEQNLLAIGLNPSTANSKHLDPTSRNVQQIANQHGYDGWYLVNLYPKRCPKPKDLPKRQQKALSQENLSIINDLLLDPSYAIKDVWLCWGNNILKHTYLMNQAKEIHQILNQTNRQPLCIGKTSLNQPMQPAPMTINTKLAGIRNVRLQPF